MRIAEMILERDVEIKLDEHGKNYMLTYRKDIDIIYSEGVSFILIDPPYSERSFAVSRFFLNLDAEPLLIKGRRIRLWTTEGSFVHEIEIWVTEDEGVFDKGTNAHIHGWIPIWSCALKNVNDKV